MSQQRHDYFHFERGINISEPNVCTVVAALGNATSLDSHYLLDAYDNGMMHGMTQFNRIQHQHNHDRGVPAAANVYHSGTNPSTSTAVSQNYQCFNAASSSSAVPSNARHTENGIPMPPHCSSWSRSGESIMVHDHNHLFRGNYSGQHFQPATPPWSNQQLNCNNNESHALAWHQSLPMPYIQAPTANGTSLENAMMGLQRYHDNAGSRSGHIFPHPPPFNPQYHSFHHQSQPLQEIRGRSINFHPPVIAPSRRVPTNHPRSSTLIQNYEMGARHVGPVPFAHTCIFRPHRSNMHVTTVRHQNLPPLSFLHLHDDVALMSDHHSDMRLDIEDMSYEELLALGEQIGKVNTGLSEEMITRQMKTKSYILPTYAINLEEADSKEQEPDSCIICQAEYKNREKIGILQCGHEYHADCLKKWLLEKNVCPICKSEALTTGEKCV